MVFERDADIVDCCGCDFLDLLVEGYEKYVLNEGDGDVGRNRKVGMKM